MKTVGFPINNKENEFRRAILPNEIKLLSHPEMIFIEKNFGNVMGITDEEYIEAGCNVCSHEEVLKKDIICDPKIGDSDYLEKLESNTVIFGWIHATQNRDITDRILSKKLTAYAWEKMYDMGRHVFWFNNELAGEAAVIHAFQCHGILPYGLQVAVLGNGNTARGAVKVLNMLGAEVMQYNHQQEELFKKELKKYDVIVNCILWDVQREDHIIYRSDLKKMKKNSMIIDVSCDRAGGIETSTPTTIENPTYIVDEVLHYVVDHTPSIFHKTFSVNNSKVIYSYIEQLIEGNIGDILKNSKIIENGQIIDREIVKYQKRF